MKFYVRDIEISSGGVPVALVNKEDAAKLDIHVGDRILIQRGVKKAHVIVDIAQSEKVVSKGEIGLFQEVIKILNTHNNDTIDVQISEKPFSLKYIKEKLNGSELQKDEIYQIVKDIVDNNLTDTELAYFVSGCYTNGLSMKETVDLTKAIVDTGSKLKLDHEIIVDKHCVGGVPGNRTTMCVVPILLAAGLTVPKTSSRAITSPSGTADTMEVLAKVELNIEQLKDIARKVGGFIVWGGSMNLAAADDKLIRIRHPLSLDPEGMLLASIMAKKSSVGSKYVLIDIPVGPDVKTRTKQQANQLKKKFIDLGKKLGMTVKVVITDGSQPIGYGIGSALEARDVLKVLRNEPDAPQDLRKKTLFLASTIFEMVRKHIKDPEFTKKRSTVTYAKYLLDSGKAYGKMRDIIMMQGGNPNILPDEIKLGSLIEYYQAKRKGKIVSINNNAISKIARTLGSPVDQGSGLFLKVKKGYLVKRGDPLFIAYSFNKDKMDFAKKFFDEAIVIK